VHHADRVVAVVGGLLDPPEDGTGDVRAGRDHLRGTDLDAYDKGTRGYHGIERRVRTPPAGLLTDPGDEPALLQSFHQLGSRHLGQARQLAELGTGQRALAQQQLKGGPVVYRPQQPRRTRKTG
jgi:hypothetical protein